MVAGNIFGNFKCWWNHNWTDPIPLWEKAIQRKCQRCQEVEVSVPGGLPFGIWLSLKDATRLKEERNHYSR